MKDKRQTIYRIIRIGYTGDLPSRLFDIVIAVSILANLFIIFFETFDVSKRYLPALSIIELVTVIIFTVEYLLRLVTADLAYPGAKTFAAAVAAFVFSLYGIIDLVSFLPYWISLAFPAAAIPSGAVAFRMLRVVRILRLFRINRYYDAFNVITDVIREKKNQILSALFIILMLVLAASVIMYNLEHEAQPEAFKNAFSGIWWAVSTLLTVGYGDIYPVTTAGRVVGIILAFLGVGIVAVPTGIISAGFVEHYTRIKDLEGVSDEYPLGFVMTDMVKGHKWLGMKAGELPLPEDLTALAVLRGKDTFPLKADTNIREGDRLIIASFAEDGADMMLGRIIAGPRSEWIGDKTGPFSEDLNVSCLRINREGRSFVPDGDTVIKSHDSLIVFRRRSGGRM